MLGPVVSLKVAITLTLSTPTDIERTVRRGARPLTVGPEQVQAERDLAGRVGHQEVLIERVGAIIIRGLGAVRKRVVEAGGLGEQDEIRFVQHGGKTTIA